MILFISPPPANASALNSFPIPDVRNILAQLLATLRPSFSSAHRTAEAIGTLRDPSASPDQCDWAERYLCGAVDGDARRYCEGRRWQS